MLVASSEFHVVNWLMGLYHMLVFPKTRNYYIATAPPTETPKDNDDIIAVSHVISLETIVLDWQTQLPWWQCMDSTTHVFPHRNLTWLKLASIYRMDQWWDHYVAFPQMKQASHWSSKIEEKYTFFSHQNKMVLQENAYTNILTFCVALLLTKWGMGILRAKNHRMEDSMVST